MTTTSFLQAGPDFWSSKEEALAYTEKTKTNKRYENFFQDIFHAGDEDQFHLYRGATNGNACLDLPSLSSNLFEDIPLEIWPNYKSVDANATLNTFRYIFHKFKKGIFVKIKDNKLHVFLPFSKANFTNEWSSNIQQEPQEIIELLRQISQAEGRQFFDEKTINTNVKEWFGNNCLVRYEKPLSEGDSNVGNVKNMLEELCARRKVPDIEFFINRRDFPIITRDGTEAYNHLWGSEHVSLVSHSYDKYLPILSMSATERYADVIMPTWDDWARIQSLEGKYFPRTVQDYSATFDVEWSNKIPTAVFRGSTTGCGVDIETNIRLKLAKLSIDSDPKAQYLDARITKWNIRPRKLENETKLRTIDIESLKRQGIDVYKRDDRGGYLLDTSKKYYRFDKRIGKYIEDPRGWYVLNSKGNYTNVGIGGKYISYKLSPKEQSKYKYIVHVDGHVSAFRLSLELSMGCVILLVDSPWKIWYRDLLKEGVHYVSVKSDLSDLIEKIRWCRSNDAECEKIANNARVFFNTYLQKDGVMDYMQKTLAHLKQEMGIYLYNSVSPLDGLISKEETDIDMTFPDIPTADDRTIQKGIGDLRFVPNIERCYGLLQGLGWAIRKVIRESNGNFEQVATVKEKQIFSNNLGIVRDAEIAGFRLAIKSTSDQQKMKEHIHETFLGSNCLNKLSQHVPNFAYVFGMYKDSGRGTVNVISEFIEGKTLSAYIDDTDNFSFKEYLFIVVQLCLAVEVAQNTCGFVHYDLAPWNVVLRPISETKDYDYLLSHKLVIKVRTKLIPVMIDFGKSHAIVDGVHHGFVNMFKASSCQDIINLLVRSLDHIVNKFLSEQKFRDKLKSDGIDMVDILHLANFISGTKYRPKKFVDLEDLRDFLKHARKYESLIYDRKYELEKRTPFDLVKHIMKMTNKPKDVGTVTKYVNLMDKGNGRQVFEYIFSNSVEERLQSYVNVYSRLMKSTLPQPNNLFFIYYTAQSLEKNLTSVRDHMIRFLNENGISDEKYEKIYQDTMSFLRRVYETKIETETEKEVIYKLSDHFKKLEPAVYTEETFLCPRKILELLEDETLDDLSDYKNIIETILLDDVSYYKLKDNHRKYYLVKFEKLLLLNSLIMKNNSSNITTLRFMSREIYTKDKAELELKLTKKGTICDDVKEYSKLYDSIILKLN